MPAKQEDQLAVFYELSVLLTGFDDTDLRRTAAGRDYFDKLVEGIGETNLHDLLDVVKKVRGSVAQFRRRVWDDADGRFSPVARNILLMWYLGSWFPLPEEWYQKFAADVSPVEGGVVSVTAYREGLVWRAMKAHAPGANPPGFGSWSIAPDLEIGVAEKRHNDGVSRKNKPKASRKK